MSEHFHGYVLSPTFSDDFSAEEQKHVRRLVRETINLRRIVCQTSDAREPDKASLLDAIQWALVDLGASEAITDRKDPQ